MKTSQNSDIQLLIEGFIADKCKEKVQSPKRQLERSGSAIPYLKCVDIFSIFVRTLFRAAFS